MNRFRINYFQLLAAVCCMAMAASVTAQQGALVTRHVYSGQPMDTPIFGNPLGSGWSTYLVKPFCVPPGAGGQRCTDHIIALAADHDNQIIYMGTGTGGVVSYHVQTGTYTLGPDFSILAGGMAFNPNNGHLYAVRVISDLAPSSGDAIFDLDPSSGSDTMAMAIDNAMYNISEICFNPADNLLYAYHPQNFLGTAAPSGVYAIDVLGDHSITQVIGPPVPDVLGGAGFSALVWGDDIYALRGDLSTDTSFKASLSNPGAGWTEIVSPPGTPGGSTIVGWLAPPITQPCPADIAGNDNNVDVNDLFALLANWNSDGPGADLAPPNNVIDVADLFTLLAAWGACN